ncbi:MAG: hypothetical protein EOO62_07215 [Hymenobacter sp.]|nr:MAG: hypothetical protein EOO62_07215 [Hymenobacter sp.]
MRQLSLSSSAYLVTTVFRLALRPYLAFLLLLCLVRTLLPEAWVLALHSHGHTTEVAASRRPTGQPLASSQHTHCHAEQFYNTPFTAALPIRVPQPRLRTHYQPLAVPAQVASLAAVLRSTALRGPPLA